MKILVSDNISEKGLKILRSEKDLNIVVKTDLSHDDLLKEIKDYDGLIIRSATEVKEDVIESAEKLRIIGRAGIGMDNVDLEAASKKGIIVMNTPGGNTITTAEHAIAMMLAISRNIPQANASMKEGKWEKKKFTGVEVFRKTLGIIGLGRIGAIVAQKAQGLGMNVLGNDPYISEERAKEVGVKKVELKELLKNSDYITLHCSKSDDTVNLIGKEEFSLMKDGVRIINCARGGLIDENALYEAIKDGKVAGAALDVFEKEPPKENPLLSLDSVITTPHLGASTGEAQENVAIDIANQIVDFFKSGQVKNAVNVPSLDYELLIKIEPYLNLAEKLGSFQAQMVEGGIKEVVIKYHGEIVNLGVKPITNSVLKGLLQVFLQNRVNVVNAPYLAKERGIEVVESTSTETEDYANLIILEVKTDKTKGTVGGTIYGKRDPRIVKIDNYRLEAVPSGHMMVFSNKDVPGMIGKIGTILGENNINIAGMQLGRVAPKGDAVSVVNVDSPVPEEVLNEIRSLPYIFYAKMIRL
ncbi:MAG TPA: phosphoglycerate dehydrogenase [Nitrospinota bacterium]|nr:phosphoglycerate dehydrogenase [Nitrospinota bacterium]